MDERKRKGFTALAALSLPFVTLAVRSVPWIPSYKGAADAVAGLLVLGAIVATLVFGYNELYRQRGVARVLRSVGLLGVVLMLSFFAMLEVFPPRFVREVAVPGTVAYIYDSGFLDPEVTVTLRRGSWPFEDKLVTRGACNARDVVLDGTTLVVCARRCDTLRRRCQ